MSKYVPAVNPDVTHWVRRVVDERVRSEPDLRARITRGVTSGLEGITVTITKAPQASTEDRLVWEKKCDRCGIVDDERRVVISQMFTLPTPRGLFAIMAMGNICHACADHFGIDYSVLPDSGPGDPQAIRDIEDSLGPEGFMTTMGEPFEQVEHLLDRLRAKGPTS